MKLRHVCRSLASGAVIYIAMAACGAAESANAPLVDDGGGGGSLDALVDSFVDEVASPVKDAKAGPLAPLTFDEPCDKDIQISGTTAKGAVHAFPGKTVNDLALLRVVIPISGISFGGVPFDRATAADIFLSPGAALVACTAGQTVTFVLPQ